MTEIFQPLEKNAPEFPILGKTTWIMLALAMLTLAVFWPAVHYQAINLDDHEYVFRNPQVLTGLRPSNITWAFTQVHERWWLPMLWISYMADATFLGVRPGAFHLTNILLHAASAMLLFWVLWRTTGARWRSAFVAALFAIHPLRVESVAWITERKDVLSGLFWMLTLLAYVRYAKSGTLRSYALVFLAMLLGGMSKPIVITLPAILLLLDFWPLRRLHGAGNWKRCLWEKIPLLLLSVLFTAITLSTHALGVSEYAGTDWLARLNLIPRNVFPYLAKLVWPVNLTVLHPEYDAAHWPLFAGAVAVLAAVTFACWRLRRQAPYLLVGWLWFLIVLSPVLRGIRMGLSGYADRFAYLPSIGLFIIAAWGVTQALSKTPKAPILLGALAGAVLLASAGVASYNLRFWRSSETLFSHALKIYPNNYLAANNLAEYYQQTGQPERARPYFELCVREGSKFPKAAGLVGNALWKLGRLEEAVQSFQTALQSDVPTAQIYNNLGLIRYQQGQYAPALDFLKRAIAKDPALPDAHFNLGLALLKLNRPLEALPLFEKASVLNPWDDTAHYLAGQLLMQQGRYEEARTYYLAALRLKPGHPEYRSAIKALPP